MNFSLPGNRKFLGSLSYLLCLLLPILAMYGCGKEEKPPEVIRTIRWMRAAEASATEVRKISGTIKPVDESLLSFAVGGTVEKVPARLGDSVERNQVLAELDRQPFVLAVREAEAALTKAKATLIESRANYERYLGLYESNNASKAELDEARAGFESAKSQVKASEAQLGLARRDLRKTILRAPFNGVISERDVDPFQEVAAGKPVFQIESDESGFEVSAAVPDVLVIQLIRGEEADVYFPALKNRKVRGVITEIGSRSQTASTYPVTVELKEQFPELRSGMSVEVAFAYRQTLEEGKVAEKGLKIPVSALLAGDAEKYSVFIYDEKTSTVKKTMVTGIALIGNDVIIGSGLKEGDIVATAGVGFLVDGQKVKLMQETK